MVIILSIVTFVLIALLIVAFIAIRNLLSQNDTLLENLQIYSNKIEQIEDETIKYHKYFLELFTQTYQELQRVNKRGSFSSDDEVGFAFRVILSAIETAKNKLLAIETEEEVYPEKKT
jgi:biopolymer transport protein ExbB/TolQ